ncbi:MAG: class I SAM-dependent methyltransferase [Betaproteobacteria bacterium]|nr:MAG: class I SAM-dependent methyltransferase [Betaproteobacteria bacterium]
MTDSIEWIFEPVQACLICGGQQSSTVLERTIRSIPLRFVRCKACSLVYQNPRPTSETLKRYFSSTTFVKDSDNEGYSLDELLGYPDYLDWDISYRKSASLRLGRIARFTQPPRELLEIGTATGSFLAAARAAGYSVRGLDVSETLARIARERFGLEIDTGFIEDFPLPERHYDVICAFGGIACWSDPVRGLANVARALKPGGLLVINHPNLDSLFVRALNKRYFEFNHASLTVLSNTTMRLCLDRAGFRILFSENERQFASVGRIVSYLKLNAAARLSKFMRFAHWIVPVIAFGTTFSISTTK